MDQLDSKHRVAESEEEIDSSAEGESCIGGVNGRRGVVSIARLWTGGTTHIKS